MESNSGSNPSKDVLFVNNVSKYRDQKGNSVIQGGAGALYRIIAKKSLLASGSLCKIKLCKDVSENNGNKHYAIKRFNKLTLKKHK